MILYRDAGCELPNCFAGDERDLEDDEVVGIFQAEKRRRVQEAPARQLVDDLEEVVR
jgi:hypothetical protein